MSVAVLLISAIPAHSHFYVTATETQKSLPELFSEVSEAAPLDTVTHDLPPSPEEIATAQPLFSDEIRVVPFYSQLTDISSPQWQKVGCGIASLAMVIEYYKPNSVSVNELLKQGIAADAFLPDAGWTHGGLIGLSQKYGLDGASHSLAESSMSEAFQALEEILKEGPVMVSVHYTFDPQNPIPHLVVVNTVENGKVYYNDPAERAGGGSISISKFQSAWKKRYIAIRPVS